MTELEDAWQSLPEPWQLAYSQAWAAYQDRCCPVGAVILDPEGAVVSQARNRVRSTHTPYRDLADTRVAHAGLNALAQIPSVTQHIPWAMYSTIEPCMMCIGALVTLRVQNLFFASTESYAGAAKIVANASKGEVRSIADLMPNIHGPIANPISDLFLDLYVAYHSWMSPSGPVARAYEIHYPSLYRRAWATAEVFEPHRKPKGSTLSEVLAMIDVVVLT
jgi:tRNA(Arg) A34 adenosine deaminase TadA